MNIFQLRGQMWERKTHITGPPPWLSDYSPVYNSFLVNEREFQKYINPAFILLKLFVLFLFVKTFSFLLANTECYTKNKPLSISFRLRPSRATLWELLKMCIMTAPRCTCKLLITIWSIIVKWKEYKLLYAKSTVSTSRIRTRKIKAKSSGWFTTNFQTIKADSWITLSPFPSSQSIYASSQNSF